MATISSDILNKIDGIKLSPRAANFREQLFTCTPRVALDRALLARKSYEETEGDPIEIRFGKLTKKILEELPVTIFPKQKIVGNSCPDFRGACLCIDYNSQYLLPLIKEETGKLTLGGPVEKGLMSKEDWNTLLELVKFWQGKTPVDRISEAVHGAMGTWYDDLVDSGGAIRYEAILLGPAGIDWKTVVEKGLRGYIQEAEQHIKSWSEGYENDVNKLNFWKSMVMSLQGVVTLAHRYAKAAREMATSEKDPQWRKEMEEIARACEWVPENPARTFREALQSIVLIHLAQNVATGYHALPAGWGRVDQYLYPCFKRDLVEGRLTVEEAADMMVDFFSYSARLDWVMDESWRDYAQHSPLILMGLGGKDENGQPASNELSYLFLHMGGLLRYAEPHLSLLWNKDIPRWVMRKAVETNLKVGGGVPQFQNGDHWEDYMLRRGVAREKLGDWGTHGCSQVVPAGEWGSPEPSYYNAALCLDLALHNGVASKTGKKLGPETGDPRTFKTFEELYRAWQTQVEHVFNKELQHDEIVDRVRGQYYRQPLASTFVPNCLEKGMDYNSGGMKSCRVWYKKDRGLTTVADSLMAVKKLVYEEKKLTMAELLEAVDSNFAGERGEEIRRMCMAAPKYGNDIDEVDYLLRDVGRFTGNVILSRKNIFGDNYCVNRDGQAWHWYAGKRMGALPNGHKAGEPLYDASLSAGQGLDRNGPTALLNSALKANFKQEAWSGIMTIRFPTTLLQSAEGRDKVMAMTESYFDQGGTYLQFNILDAKVLREAKLHPEKYRDLVVRVGGYSAYFINLSPEVQDEIISRTEHTV